MGDYVSMWHDIPMKPPMGITESNVVTMVTEISMFSTPKMELQKALPNNPIAQDTNKDGSSRFYTYGVPFFNYGFVPQTWEDPLLISQDGYGGDNDPIDVIEFGSIPLQMGSINPCRVLGSLELIDEGETDHKMLCIHLDDPLANEIHSLDDLERVKPNTLNRLRDWLKRYKTSDGKPENSLASDIPRSIEEAMNVIEETHARWYALCGLDGYTQLSQLSPKALEFWLSSPTCRGGY